ncbi:MAG: type II secretion system protein M [Sphingobium sp.]|nr:type II secretion system protein M [Sphingobium sp.]
MMDGVKIWWLGRARREQILLGAMLVLMAGIILWLGLWRPSQQALRDAALANAEAVERHADMVRKTGWLKQGEGGIPGGNGGASGAGAASIEQMVTQSAAEAGFTPDRVQAQGMQGVELTIASARSTALLGWITTLEKQGIAIERAMISPSGANGTVSAQLSFRRSGDGAAQGAGQ